MLEEGEKTPEPLQQMPTSPPPSITTHSYTAASCSLHGSPVTLVIKRRAGRSEDVTRLSIGNKPELFAADITVSPPTPGELLTFVCYIYPIWVSLLTPDHFYNTRCPSSSLSISPFISPSLLLSPLSPSLLLSLRLSFSTLHLALHLSISLSISPSLPLSLHLSLHLSISLSLSPSLHLSLCQG